MSDIWEGCGFCKWDEAEGELISPCKKCAPSYKLAVKKAKKENLNKALNLLKKAYWALMFRSDMKERDALRHEIREYLRIKNE